ncbi:hypothetical protein N7536_009221 [Penicillium majusculum]|nr:hypothetical protein N7536_009221 [Penicillium majusculum]
MAEANSVRRAESGITLASLETWTEVTFSLANIGRKYDPSGTVSCMDVFCDPLRGVAAWREEYRYTQLNRWEEFVSNDLNFHEVDGHHYTMFSPDRQPLPSKPSLLRPSLSSPSTLTGQATPTSNHKRCHIPPYKRCYQRTLAEGFSRRVFILQSATHAVDTSPFDAPHISKCFRQLALRGQSSQSSSPLSSPNPTLLRGPPHSSTLSALGDPHFFEIPTANAVNLPVIKAPAPASDITTKPTTPDALIIGNPVVKYNDQFNTSSDRGGFHGFRTIGRLVNQIPIKHPLRTTTSKTTITSLTVAGFGFRTIGRLVSHPSTSNTTPLRTRQPSNSSDHNQSDCGGLHGFRAISRLVTFNQPLRSITHFESPTSISLTVAGSSFRTIGRLVSASSTTNTPPLRIIYIHQSDNGGLRLQGNRQTSQSTFNQLPTSNNHFEQP